MARNPLPRSNFGTASLVDRRDSLPEVELEEGLSADVDIQDESIIQAPGMDIELEEDGSVVINFDPSDSSPVSSDFYANLAEDLSDRAASRISSDLIEQYESNKLGRKDWEEAYTTGLELLGSRRRLFQNSCLREVPSVLRSWASRPRKLRSSPSAFGST